MYTAPISHGYKKLLVGIRLKALGRKREARNRETRQEFPTAPGRMGENPFPALMTAFSHEVWNYLVSERANHECPIYEYFYDALMMIETMGFGDLSKQPKRLITKHMRPS